MPSIAYLDLKYGKSSTVDILFEDAFTITALSDNVNLCFIVSEYKYDGYTISNESWNFKISYDSGMTWSDVSLTAGTDTIYAFNSIDTGESIMIVGDDNNTLDGISICTTGSTQLYNVSGNILTLIDYQTYKTMSSIPVNACFANLFNPAKEQNRYRTLVDASKLKLLAITLKAECYGSMFANNTLLLYPPKLPATTLEDGCYVYMFKNCSSLVTAPSLLATELANYCYGSMFQGCSSLQVPPILPATTLAVSCYNGMFQGCSSLQVPPILPATTLAVSCYNGMFRNCKSLVAAPVLPATTLQERCYSYMFNGCTSLHTAPDLPATTLQERCYSYMFNGCTNLNYIKILAETRATQDTRNWVYNVAPSGIFVKNASTQFDIDSTDGVPVGWTVYGEDDSIPDVYDVTITITPPDSGAVSGVGRYYSGEQVILHATPAEGYSFNCWELNHNNVSSNPYYIFNIYNNSDFTARFMVTPEIQYYTITLLQDPNVGAILQGGGVHELGENITIIAPNVYGYNFIGWYDSSNNLVSLGNAYMTTVLQDFTYVAKYEAKPEEIEYFDITLQNLNPECGTVTGSGRYAKNSEVTINAIANDHYGFVCWLLDGSSVYSTDEQLTITVTEDLYLVPQWEVRDDYSHMYLTIESLFASNYVCVYCSYEGSVVPTIQYSLNNNPWYTVNLYKGENTIAICNTNDVVRFRNFTAPSDYYTGTLSGQYIDKHYISIYASKNYNIMGNVMSIYQDHLDIDENTPSKYYKGKNLTVLGTNERFYKLCKHGDWNDYLISADNLVLPATTLSDGCYCQMFSGCINMTSSPELPATTLAESCYAGMFSFCLDLAEPPALPALTLLTRCYNGMFTRCESLTNPPEVPATTLANNCYRSMFSSCISLESTPLLRVQVMQEECYSSMFQDCTSLVNPPVLPATTLATYCYSSMFKGCTSLVNSSILNATVLANGCYNQMYSGCTSLENVTTLPAKTMVDNCYSFMFSGCTSLRNAPALPATTLAPFCYQGMFEGCTALGNAPVLPATRLRGTGTSSQQYSYAVGCYNNMFENCSHLGVIKAYFTDSPYYDEGTTEKYIWTKNWVNNVLSVGTFTKSNSAHWDVNGPNGVPLNWTIQYHETT